MMNHYRSRIQTIMALNADAGGGAPVVQPASVLKPNDHYILRKLANQLLPSMLAGQHLRRQWIVGLAAFYSYTGDLSAALAGLGIGAPLASLASGKAPAGENAFDVIRRTLPPGWVAVGAAALVIWAILRLVVQREDVIARALLAKECAKAMSERWFKLYTVLDQPNPLRDIATIQESVAGDVQKAIANRVWPERWLPLPPAELISKELAAKVDEIRVKFMPSWAPPPPGAA
jgi:hypothetical protein